jgi:hypothetical protein
VLACAVPDSSTSAEAACPAPLTLSGTENTVIALDATPPSGASVSLTHHIWMEFAAARVDTSSSTAFAPLNDLIIHNFRIAIIAVYR